VGLRRDARGLAGLKRIGAATVGRRVGTASLERPQREDRRMETHGRLVRSSSDRMIAGVCGGLARWLGWDATLVRVAYVVVSILSAAFPGLLVYILLWIVMPREA
jgi:phage shock protein C